MTSVNVTRARMALVRTCIVIRSGPGGNKPRKEKEKKLNLIHPDSSWYQVTFSERSGGCRPTHVTCIQSVHDSRSPHILSHPHRVPEPWPIKVILPIFVHPICLQWLGGITLHCGLQVQSTQQFSWVLWGMCTRRQAYSIYAKLLRIRRMKDCKWRGKIRWFLFIVAV